MVGTVFINALSNSLNYGRSFELTPLQKKMKETSDKISSMIHSFVDPNNMGKCIPFEEILSEMAREIKENKAEALRTPGPMTDSLVEYYDGVLADITEPPNPNEGQIYLSVTNLSYFHSWG